MFFGGANDFATLRPSSLLGACTVTTVNKDQPIDLATNCIGQLSDPLMLTIDLIYNTVCCLYH